MLKIKKVENYLCIFQFMINYIFKVIFKKYYFKFYFLNITSKVYILNLSTKSPIIKLNGIRCIKEVGNYYK
jgi:hypothetical protein